MLSFETPDGGVVSVYDDVRAIPASRYQRFSAKFLEYAMGTDVFAAEGHLQRMALFLQAGNLEHLKLEFNQLVLGLSSVQDEVNGPAVVLACLVASIGAEARTDLTDAGLLDTARLLVEAGATQGQLTQALDSAKKALSATS